MTYNLKNMITLPVMIYPPPIIKVQLIIPHYQILFFTSILPKLTFINLQIVMHKLIRNVIVRSYFSTQTNYFKLFNLPYDFTQQQLKASYLQLVKKHHPDLTSDPISHQIFKQVQLGYQVLSDQAKRNQHQAQQKQQSSNLGTEDSNAKSVYEQMKDKFYTNYVRKDPINDQFNFTYKMFKEHYEKVEAPKAAYQKYEGQGSDHYYARKDEKGQPFWKQAAAAASALGVIGLAFAYIHS